jgi:hypothetical protein
MRNRNVFAYYMHVPRHSEIKIDVARDESPRRVLTQQEFRGFRSEEYLLSVTATLM